MTDVKDDTKTAPTGLELLREPFRPNQISKLPKPTAKQTEEVRNDFKKGIRCQICGAWHHKDVVHLDYVGHAALTDRLLDCDPAWNWEPLSFTQGGNPAMDENGGMWIKLTVCNVTRYGYGHPDGKKGGNAIKEVIGDALRNAAMRFGAALDLWHKGDLHADDDAPAPAPQQRPATINADQFVRLKAKVEEWGGDESKFLAGYKAPSLDDFPLQSLAAAMIALQTKIDAAAPPPPVNGNSLETDSIPY